MSSMTDPEQLRDIRWLREMTGLSESGIRRLCRSKTLPHIRVGRRVLFKISSVQRFLDSREIGGDIPARRGRRPNARSDKDAA